jgi:predicted nuclease of predicted toxin-antitoxin system
MRLLLDECAGDRDLRDALIAHGHDVLRSVDVLGGGADDSAVFAFACHNNRVVVTFNNADFAHLAAIQATHPGLLLIYQDNRPSDMAAADIVKALSNVIDVRPNGISGELVVLNQYRW